MSELSPNMLIVLKLLLSMLCGGAIGIERELSRKPAGLRTNVLIAMSATLLMITSRHISGGAPYTDPARLVAQVVVGVGFIGGGVIIQSRGSVTGLTTAATIFIVTAVGISIGEGMFGAALLTTLLIIFVLVLLRRAERGILRRRRLYHYSFKTRDPASALASLLDLLETEGMRLDDFSIKDMGQDEHQVSLSVVTSLDGNSRLIKSLPQLGTGLDTSTHDEME
ncbi:MAG TPA: MgtC/SapB family protein [Pyrinomonadaceae bacterium]